MHYVKIRHTCIQTHSYTLKGQAIFHSSFCVKRTPQINRANAFCQPYCFSLCAQCKMLEELLYYMMTFNYVYKNEETGVVLAVFLER